MKNSEARELLRNGYAEVKKDGGVKPKRVGLASRDDIAARTSKKVKEILEYERGKNK